MKLAIKAKEKRAMMMIAIMMMLVLRNFLRGVFVGFWYQRVLAEKDFFVDIGIWKS
ncbi:MAG: hypothetical protein LBU27_06980 [Candidatus Peribacteria bacterium]|nr:hypothetical protein [Candidatus Peribacteria bacterium]